MTLIITLDLMKPSFTRQIAGSRGDAEQYDDSSNKAVAVDSRCGAIDNRNQ